MYFIECTSIGIGLMIFFVTKLGLWVWGRKATEVKYHFHPIILRVHTIIMTCHHSFDLGHLAEVGFVRFLLGPLSL